MGTDNGSLGSQAAEESVSFVNSKNLGDQPAFYVGLAMRGAVEAANAFSSVTIALASKASKYVLEADPAEAMSIQKLFSDGVSAQIAQLGAAIASIQQSMKGAQSTPPETAVPK